MSRDSLSGSGNGPSTLAIRGKGFAHRAFRESSRRFRKMDEQQLTKQLQDEGFDDVYVWEDSPDMNYPPHQHPDVSAHIILAGEMTVTVDGQTRTYKPGERFDIPGKTPHSARMGPEGCNTWSGKNKSGGLRSAVSPVEPSAQNVGGAPVGHRWLVANPCAIPPNLFARRPPFSWPPHEPTRACALRGRDAHF